MFMRDMLFYNNFVITIPDEIIKSFFKNIYQGNK